MTETVEAVPRDTRPWLDQVKRVGLVVLLALVGALAGGFVASQQTARYESTVRLLVGPIGGDRSTLDAAGLLSGTYADLASSRTLVSRVAEELSVAVDDDDVTALADQQSRIIMLTVTNESALTAQVMADALAAELTEVVAGDAATPGQVADPSAQIRVLDEAGEGERVERLTPVLVGGGALLGAAVGLLLLRTGSLRRDARHDSLEFAGAPVLEIGTGRPDARVDVDDWDLLAAQLRHALTLNGPYSTVAYVPLNDDAELDSVFLQLIAAEARAGRRVVASDAASNRVEPPAGSAVLIGEPGADDALMAHRVVPYRTDDERDVPAPGGLLLVGSAVGDDTESGTMRRLRHVIEHLRGQRDLVLAAWCPSPSASSVAVSAASVLDRLVLVARAGRFRPDEIRRLRERFASVGAHPAAVVEIGDAAAAVEVMLRLDEGAALGRRFEAASLPPSLAAELAHWQGDDHADEGEDPTSPTVDVDDGEPDGEPDDDLDGDLGPDPSDHAPPDAPVDPWWDSDRGSAGEGWGAEPGTDPAPAEDGPDEEVPVRGLGARLREAAASEDEEPRELSEMLRSGVEGSAVEGSAHGPRSIDEDTPDEPGRADVDDDAGDLGVASDSSSGHDADDR